MIYFYLSKFFVNFIKNQLKNILYKELLNLTDKLNNIFKNVDNEIVKLIFKTSKIRNRKSKLSFVDVLIYIFNYSFTDTTKQQIVSDYNFKNNTDYHRSSFYKKNSIFL